MSNPPPVEFQPGMEIVPGYTLISPLGSGMAGDVWQAQAAGGIKVALKVVRSLSVLGGRKELKALKVIRDVHHPNLCPLFGFWTKDAEGRVLADGETEDLTFDSVSAPGVGQTPAPRPSPNAPKNSSSGEVGGTMAIGDVTPQSYVEQAITDPGSTPESEPAKPKVTAEQLIVVMGLGDCTLYDRLRFVRHEAGLGPESVDVACGLDPAETIRYLRASASAIDMLNQEHQIYHCDIKPQNILLVGGEAQVCDFGLAKRIEGDMRQTQQAFATPAYAPPEVLHNEGYSRQVDQYSLAVTYYELRTGLLPFDITTHASMLVAKSTGKLNLNALTPPERKVLQKALRRVPSERYDSCAEFTNALAVAAGVDKSGGITVKRILAFVAAFVLAACLGITAWSYVDPVGFRSVVSGGKVVTEHKLKVAEDLFGKTKNASFQDSQSLIQVLGLAAEVAEQSEDETREEAQQLYTRAATDLIGKVHLSLQEVESNQPLSLPEPLREKLDDCLSQLDVQQSDPTSNVFRGLNDWSNSEDSSRRDAYDQFRSLYHAAVVRFDLLGGDVEGTRHVEALRTAIEERPEDFEDATGINLSLASVLPVISTLPAAGPESLSARQWLEDTRLSDVIRAGTTPPQFNPGSAYHSQWSVIRATFSVAVVPSVIDSATAEAPITNQQRDRILKTFPNLQVEKQIADLRSHVKHSEWDQAEPLMSELKASRLLNPNQSMFLTGVQALATNRDKENALELAFQAIDGANITLNQARQMRLQPLLSSYMRELGNRAMESDSRSSRFYEQMRFAETIQSDLDTTIPNAFVSGAAISLLRESLDSISNPETAAELGLERWLAMLEADQASTTLAAAIRIEREIGSRQPSKSVVTSAMQSLEKSEPGYLNSISAVYVDYLLGTGASVCEKDLGGLTKKLKGASRQSMKSLGNKRLERGTRVLVSRAIVASEVTDSDFVSRRYSEKSASPSSVARARDYLALGAFFSEQADLGLSPQLANELLLEAVATGGVDAPGYKIPLVISEKLTDAAKTAELPIQVLKALHDVGLEKLSKTKGARPRSEIIMRLLIRPATELINQVGVERFGPLKKHSDQKRFLVESIVYPTINHAVISSLRFEDGQLFPSGLKPDANLNLDEFCHLCQLASGIYQDPLAMNLYPEATLYREHCIAIAALGSLDKRLSAAGKQDLLIGVVSSAIAIADAEETQLLALAGRLSQAGARDQTVGYLRGVAFEKLANASLQRVDRGRSLRQAFDACVSALKTSEGDTRQSSEAGRKQLYELTAMSADLGVRLAFLQLPEDKLAILSPSLVRADQAISQYEVSWGDNVNFPIVSAYITKGNACEDIAHYCSQPDEEALQQAEDAVQEATDDQRDALITQRDALITQRDAMIARREENFGLAITAFEEAKSRNETDYKTRFSLGRCQFRYAMTLEDDAKMQQLKNASESLGDAPAKFNVQLADANELAKLAEWYVWKIKTELARDNKNDALLLAKEAFVIAEHDSTPIDFRNSLSLECGSAQGSNGEHKTAVECLLYLKAEGTSEDVIKRMGSASSLAYYYTDPQDKYFASILETLDAVRPILSLTDKHDEAYQLAKIATYCIREQVMDLSDDDARKTGCANPLLSKGIRAFSSHLDQSVEGDYLTLSKIFLRGDIEETDREPQKVFEFAAELGEFLQSKPNFNDRISPHCAIVVFYSVAYWGKSFDKMDEEKRKDSERAARRFMNQKRGDGVIFCIKKFQVLAKKRPDLVKEAENAIKTIEVLSGARTSLQQ